MRLQKFFDLHMLFSDIDGEYIRYRRKGLSRDEAISMLYRDFSEELTDMDDEPAVKIGIALALCRKKELTQAAAQAALAVTDRLRDRFNPQSREYSSAQELPQLFSDPAMFGEEKHFPKRRLYTPQWQVGDTFVQRMNHPRSIKAGIAGWYVLIRKYSEAFDRDGQVSQIITYTVCPPDGLPKTSADMEALGWLPFCIGHRLQFFAALTIGSKRAEQGLALEYLGDFPSIRMTKRADLARQGLPLPLSSSAWTEDGCALYDHECYACINYRDGIHYDLSQYSALDVFPEPFIPPSEVDGYTLSDIAVAARHVSFYYIPRGTEHRGLCDAVTVRAFRDNSETMESLCRWYKIAPNAEGFAFDRSRSQICFLRGETLMDVHVPVTMETQEAAFSFCRRLLDHESEETT